MDLFRDRGLERVPSPGMRTTRPGRRCLQAVRQNSECSKAQHQRWEHCRPEPHEASYLCRWWQIPDVRCWRPMKSTRRTLQADAASPRSSMHRAGWHIQTAGGEYIGVVSAKMRKCCCTIGADGHSIARSIVGVRPHFSNQASIENCLLIGIKGQEVFRSCADCPCVEQEFGLAV